MTCALTFNIIIQQRKQKKIEVLKQEIQSLLHEHICGHRPTHDLHYVSDLSGIKWKPYLEHFK